MSDYNALYKSILHYITIMRLQAYCTAHCFADQIFHPAALVKWFSCSSIHCFISNCTRWSKRLLLTLQKINESLKVNNLRL